MLTASVHLVTWWCGVLAEDHPPRLQTRVTYESVHQLGRGADASPVVVPQSRHQPRAVGREHQVGQGTLPERPIAVLAPGGGLLWPRLYQHVMPSRIQGHHWRIGEDNVIGAGVEIPQPPRLASRVLA